MSQWSPEILRDIHPHDTLCIRANQPDLEPTSLKKVAQLKDVLEYNKIGCDLKWCLFVTAAESYKWGQVLKPFPPMFVKQRRVKNIKDLLNVIIAVPPLDVVMHQLEDPNHSAIDDVILELLHWALVKMRLPHLRLVNKNDIPQILGLVDGIFSLENLPTHVFEVCASSCTPAQENFRHLAAQARTLFAYYGDKLEHFHMLTHYGMNSSQHRPLKLRGNRNPTVTLTNALWFARQSSAPHYGWGGSTIAPVLSCIALCEVIDSKQYVENTLHPSNILDYLMPTDTLGDKYTDLPTSHQTSGTGKDKYYIIKNQDAIRIRYLLIYAQPKGKGCIETRPTRLWKWTCIFIFPIVLFIIIGSYLAANYSSDRIQNYLKLE